MPVIFQGQPGRVVTIKDPAVPARVRPLATPNPDIGISAQKSIITHITVAQETNHQFLHTLGNDIFIYVFGDKIGQIQLGGFSFIESCSGGGGRHGMELMIDWFQDNKLSSRRDPMQILVGQVAFQGFLMSMTNRVVDPATWLTQFQANIAVIPEKKAGGGG
jgi:hypothetical protein